MIHMELMKELVGKKCQVYSENNNIVFVGLISEFDQINNQLKISDYNEEEVPWRRVVSDMKIKLCFGLGVHQDGNKRIFVDCLVEQSLKDYLLVSVETVILKEEARDNFRQNVMTDNIVFKVGDSQEEHLCKVINVSVKGIGIQSKEEYGQGDLLRIIEQKFRKQGLLHNLTCRIVRINRLENREFFYGCEFIDVTPKEERNLLNDIFALQTEELRQKRER